MFVKFRTFFWWPDFDNPLFGVEFQNGWCKSLVCSKNKKKCSPLFSGKKFAYIFLKQNFIIFFLKISRNFVIIFLKIKLFKRMHLVRKQKLVVTFIDVGWLECPKWLAVKLPVSLMTAVNRGKSNKNLEIQIFFFENFFHFDFE